MTGYFFLMILLLPFYLAGLITNYLPYMMPLRIYRASGIVIEYKTSVQLVAGLILFPLFYAIELFLFRAYVTPLTIASIYFLLSLPVLGFLSMYYYIEAVRFFRIIRFQFGITNIQKKDMIVKRDKILSLLKNAKRELEKVL